MPEDFEKCVKKAKQKDSNARVRTVTGPHKKFDLKDGEFRAVCFDEKGAHLGEKKKNQTAEELEGGDK